MKDASHPCQRAIYIEGSAREGTQPSVYDPSNMMGGAKYKPCGKEGYSKSKVTGVWLCEEHYNEDKMVHRQLQRLSKEMK